MYSKGCSAGVQQVTAAVVPQVCAPPAAHSVRTGAEPPVHHLCTTCAAGLCTRGWDPCYSSRNSKGGSKGCSQAVQQVCSWTLRWWFRTGARCALRTRCAPVRNHLCTTCAPGLCIRGWDPLYSHCIQGS